jgi:hypothetical protein
VIEVKLTNSYYYKGISFGGITTGSTMMGGDAVFWKGHYYVHDADRVIKKFSYVDNGVSFVSGTTIGISWGSYAFSLGRFIDEGATLNLFYHPNITNTAPFLVKYSTNNGLSWDGPENIFGGTIMVNFAPVNGDAVYMTLSSGVTIIPITRTTGQIWLSRKNIAGGTWGATCLYDKRVAYPTKRAFSLQALGTTANLPQWGQSSYNLYTDYVYFNYSGATGGGASDIFSGMRTFDSNRWDGFNERDVVTNDGAGYLNIIPFGMKKGASYYYHYFKLVDSLYRFVAGYTIQEDVTMGYFYQQSRNGYQWTIPRYVGPAQFNDGTPNYLDGVFAAGGATIPEMMIFTGRTAMCLWYETNEIDISADVMNYINRDNEDITITLGNYQSI